MNFEMTFLEEKKHLCASYILYTWVLESTSIIEHPPSTTQ